MYCVHKALARLLGLELFDLKAAVRAVTGDATGPMDGPTICKVVMHLGRVPIVYERYDGSRGPAMLMIRETETVGHAIFWDGQAVVDCNEPPMTKAAVKDGFLYAVTLAKPQALTGAR